MTDEYYMDLAIEEAKLALLHDDVPVGAVVVKGDEVIAHGHNERELKQDATAHAELVAIRRACEKLGSLRLDGCRLYVTLEPCAMCAGAIINARLDRVIYGAFDKNAGCCGSVINLFHLPLLHSPKITCGVREEICARILSEFFQGKR